MTISTVHSRLLSEEDRARVVETLGKLEASGALPESVQEPVLRLLRLVVDGPGAYVISTEAELTTNQAADFLGMSRPFLIKLLDEGRIPFHKVGRDRRILASDVVEFRRRRDEAKQKYAEAARGYGGRRNERLAGMSGVSHQEATELGFG